MKATLRETHDYYAFGWDKPGRTWIGNPDGYKYGFNGKLDDVNSGWQVQDYGYRMYDERLGRFMTEDPLKDKFSDLSPYAFASNSPIAHVDMDGLEAVYVPIALMNSKNKPTLKPGEWYVYQDLLTGEEMTDWESFKTAAVYNTRNMNSDAYQTVAQRHLWYTWADEVTRKKKDNYWFAAAVDVTSATMVGATEEYNPIMSHDTKLLLIAGNQYLLKQNFKNFGPYVTDDGKITWLGGNLVVEEGGGPDLDNQMVIIEMTTLQGFLDKYRDYYIKKNGQEAWDKIHNELGFIFGNSLLRKMTPEANKDAQSAFSKEFKGENFDFMKLEHRIFQGQQMAKSLRNQDKSKSKRKSKSVFLRMKL